MARRLLLLLLSLPLAATASVRIDCHTTYGGETHTLSARPVSSPYDVPNHSIGSYFLFKVVFQDRPADIASVKIYVYADRDEGPTPIHQATHPWPLPVITSTHAYGFTGQQRVYETLRDGELIYWCEQVKEGRP